jgi:hypothetical protein
MQSENGTRDARTQNLLNLRDSCIELLKGVHASKMPHRRKLIANGTAAAKITSANKMPRKRNCAQLGAVIPHADEATLIASSIVNATSFATFCHFRLLGQMRMTDTELRDAVHAVGYGTWPCADNGDHHTCAAQRVLLPVSIFPTICATDTGLEQFRRWVHPDVADTRLQGTIICSTNARAEEHNLAFLDRMHGSIHTYTARDEVVHIRDGDQAFERANISHDAARAFNGSGIPPSELVLKTGAPVYVALNLDRTEGIVKGALAVFHSMHTNMVYIRLCNPRNLDHAIWPIPRVCFHLQPDKLPILIQRRQIPLRLAWAVTVHRVIGEELDRVGIDLRDSYFAHGQLHVSISRCHNRNEARYLVHEEDFYDDEFETVDVVEPRMLFHDDLS